MHLLGSSTLHLAIDRYGWSGWELRVWAFHHWNQSWPHQQNSGGENDGTSHSISHEAGGRVGDQQKFEDPCLPGKRWHFIIIWDFCMDIFRLHRRMFVVWWSRNVNIWFDTHTHTVYMIEFKRSYVCISIYIHRYTQHVSMWTLGLALWVK